PLYSLFCLQLTEMANTKRVISIFIFFTIQFSLFFPNMLQMQAIHRVGVHTVYIFLNKPGYFIIKQYNNRLVCLCNSVHFGIMNRPLIWVVNQKCFFIHLIKFRIGIMCIIRSVGSEIF